MDVPAAMQRYIPCDGAADFARDRVVDVIVTMQRQVPTAVMDLAAFACSFFQVLQTFARQQTCFDPHWTKKPKKTKECGACKHYTQPTHTSHARTLDFFSRSSRLESSSQDS